ncbi:cytochrome c biogenesis protein CcsA [Pseudomonas aeruginosa]|nr:cytochrome c biogenesis protein CcsA [Pseudomonas aeruginosa]
MQDVGLIVHPPMLYMGYVGFSVAFAFAIAALLGGAWTPPGRAGRGPGPW